MFGDRLISRKTSFAWPAYSPDLNPCDYFLWVFLKSKVYTDPVPRTTEELKKNVIREVKKLKQETVNAAIDNLLPRLQNLLHKKGAWFEQIMNY